MKTMKRATLSAAFLGLAASLGTWSAAAQDNCAPLRDLVTIPSIESQKGLLKGLIILADEERMMPYTDASNAVQCAKQHLRYFKGYSLLDGGEPPVWPTSKGGELEGGMLPGPTLRARVGDHVQLGFYNEVNIQNFPFSLDQGLTGKTDGCDEAYAATRRNTRVSKQIYPTNPDGTQGDTMPNCLHGSSTANLHFHGTHTTPSTTGDNVLLFVRPALRDSTGSITGPGLDTTLAQFEEFWRNCHKDGTPTQYGQMPEDWRTSQKSWLQEYDRTAPYKGVIGAFPDDMKLWPKNEKQLKMGVWPQYSIGAFPYCFQLPKYGREKVNMGQAPGTHWYHAHKHGSTALNVGNGMAGAFVIEGDYDDDLEKAYSKWGGLKEHVMVVQQLETTLNLQSAGTGKPAPPFSVNGRVNPVVTMRPGEVQLWRIVNANARTFIQFDSFDAHGPDGEKVEWRHIAQDGVQFAYANYERVGAVNQAFNMSAANRVDLLVKAPSHATDYALNVVGSVSDLPSGTPQTLLTVRVTGNAMNPPMDFIDNQKDFPKLPKFLEDLPTRTLRQRTLIFNTTPGPGRRGKGAMPKHVINGKLFDGEYIDESMTLNTVEEWTVINETVGIAHPFHIHINPFQVVEVFQPNKYKWDGTEGLDPLDPDTWKPTAADKLEGPYVWWDTFPIPTAKSIQLPEKYKSLDDVPDAVRDYASVSGSTVTVKVPGYFKMRSWFADFTGVYVNHCHILAHEDRGMMQLIQVVDPTKNHYNHH